MADDLPITDTILIPAADLSWEALRAGGPGGQHQNTTDSAVRLRLDLAGTAALHPAVKRRVAEAFPSAVTDAGELIVVAREHRSQLRNLEAARERIVSRIRPHHVPPGPRRPTRPTKASKERRIHAKKSRGQVKSMRGKVDD